jgi:hypothetical protein
LAAPARRFDSTANCPSAALVTPMVQVLRNKITERLRCNWCMVQVPIFIVKFLNLSTDRSIQLSPLMAKVIVLAAEVLHNNSLCKILDRGVASHRIKK